MTGPAHSKRARRAAIQKTRNDFRLLYAEVRTCESCPMNSRIDQDIEVSGGTTVKAGWYCGHPVNRNRSQALILDREMFESLEDERVKTLDDWMVYVEKMGHFPNLCPLEIPERATVHPTGRRALTMER